MSARTFLLLVLAAITAVGNSRVSAQQTVRSTESLNGEWLFRRDDQQDWKTVDIPCDFESHEGVGFDGIGWYRRTILSPLPSDSRRIILTIQAAATETEVFCNGKSVGKHLGGWTPFECDLTGVLMADRDKTGAEPTVDPQKRIRADLLIRVDERVGHNSQGFLPVFAPHFGGLWQDVLLSVRPTVFIDTLRLAAFGDPQSGRLDVRIPVHSTGPSGQTPASVRLRVRERGSVTVAGSKVVSLSETVRSQLTAVGQTQIAAEMTIDAARIWSPASPSLYEVDVELLSDSGSIIDFVTTRAAFRDVRVDGDRLLLNGQPLQVRGILNWGYAPPQTSPSRHPDFWKKEIRLARDYGFNLMKFCLWVPPKKYLELADESGMLAWMEYPTWHSRWTPDQLPTLQKEFTEFFCYDRIHPCVVLRSLTCETGTSADLNVIRALYDLCHSEIPGSVVEDDSSWIEWNRVHDFYDDHPYGNNHTWPAALSRLRNHIQVNGVKPLVLGEAIAADTWSDPKPLLDRAGNSRPFWLPGFVDANQTWLQDRTEDMGPSAVSHLSEGSRRYAMTMRKYQIETCRREVPHGGYVVSVIRDFPFAGMGLMDFQGEAKWTPESWNWHGDQTLILKTENDRRSFRHDEILQATLMLSHSGGGSTDGQLTIAAFGLPESGSSESPYRTWSSQRPLTKPMAGGLQMLSELEIPVKSLTAAVPDQPQEIRLVASIEAKGTTTASNSWSLWILPVPKTQESVRFHASLAREIVTDVFPARGVSSAPGSEPSLIVASRFDPALLDTLEQGARVLMIPDGERGSFPLSQHWFLRGGPVVHETLTPLRNLVLDLQHFDLAGAVIPDVQWLSEMRPLIMLWDNHDIRTVKTHGLAFQTRVGKGRLLVSALRHHGATNAVGHWLLRRWLEELNSDWSGVPSLKPETVNALRGKLSQQKLELTDRKWLFRTDPDNTGLRNGWEKEIHPDTEHWKPMSIGRHWEALGHPTLDGWAWYRIDVTLPESWNGHPVYVCVEGADDHYELYVNGRLTGTAGDIAGRRTAFEERSSHEIPRALVSPDGSAKEQKLMIAFRVYDWSGAGGLFRPIFLSTTPLSASAEIIR